MGSSESNTIHATPSQNIRIPLALHLNYQSSWKLRLQLTKAEYEHDSSSSPLYTVDLPQAWHGPLNVYNGRREPHRPSRPPPSRTRI